MGKIRNIIKQIKFAFIKGKAAIKKKFRQVVIFLAKVKRTVNYKILQIKKAIKRKLRKLVIFPAKVKRKISYKILQIKKAIKRKLRKLVIFPTKVKRKISYKILQIKKAIKRKLRKLAIFPKKVKRKVSNKILQIKKAINTKFRKVIISLKKLDRKLNHKIILIIFLLSVLMIVAAFATRYYLNSFMPLQLIDNPTNQQQPQQQQQTQGLENANNVNSKESSDMEAEDPKISYSDDEKEDFNEGELPEDAEKLIQDIVKGAMDITQKTELTTLTYEIAENDSFSDAISNFELSNNPEIKKLIQEYPQISNVQVKDKVQIKLREDETVTELRIIKPNLTEYIYELDEDGNFSFYEEQQDIAYKDETVYSAVINTTLIEALQRSSIEFPSRLAIEIETAFELNDQVKFNKIKKGDHFTLVYTYKYINNVKTQDVRLQWMRFTTEGKAYYTALANNGGYYNENAESTSKNTITKTKSKIETKKIPVKVKDTDSQGNSKKQTISQCPAANCRVTSRFNGARKNPVTGRISPHNGVDFSMPIGSSVLAGGDGTVITTAVQGGGAGRYIVISHDGGIYQTVYMHLSKILTKTGDYVKKGQIIAKSGNTGRSTGPHLHYELRINGRPVNPLVYASKINLGETYKIAYKTVTQTISEPYQEEVELTEDDKQAFLQMFKEKQEKYDTE